jgi:hypothetical protein
MAEPKFPVKNNTTGAVKAYTAGEVRELVKVRDPASGKYLFTNLTNMPGFARKPNGSWEFIQVPKDKVRDAAQADPVTGTHSLWGGEGDPRIEEARSEAVSEGAREIARNRNDLAVFGESVASVVTLGQMSRAANYLAGEGAEEARSESIKQSPFAHGFGRVTGLVALGAVPIPGVGALAKGAFGVRNVSSVFEVGAAATQTARSLIMGSAIKKAAATGGKIGFGRAVAGRLGGVLAFGAVAEVPLSVAIVAADTVDNNKPLTSEFISEVAQQYMWSVALTVGTALPFAVAGEVLKRGTAAAGPLVGHSMARYVGRKYLRGRGRGGGDILESELHQAVNTYTGKANKKLAQGRIGRLIARNQTDDFIKRDRTVKQALINLRDAENPAKLVDAADTLGFQRGITPEMASDLRFIRDNSHDIVGARRAIESMVPESGKLSKQVLKSTYQTPKKLRLTSQADVAIQGGLVEAQNITSNALAKTQLTKALKAAGKARNREAFAIGMNARLAVPAGSEARLAIDRGLKRALGKKSEESFVRMLPQMDELERAAKALERSLPDIEAMGGIRSFEQAAEIRRNVQSIGGNLRKLTNEKVGALDRGSFSRFFDENNVGKSLSMETRFDDFKDSIEALGRVNKVYDELWQNASPLLRASTPKTQQEILETQLEVVISAKKRVQHALEFIAFKSAGTRQAAIFGGVMTYRGLSTIDEKRDAFVINRMAVLSSGSSPETLQASVGEAVDAIALADMELATHVASTLATANQYLLQQMPSSEDPMIGPRDFSSAEIENWLEALGAIESPVSVLATAVDGSVSDQAVDAIRTVYPEFYIEMVLDVSAFVYENRETLHDAQMHGLDTFTGGALGYTDAPGPNLTYTLPGYQTTQQAVSTGAVGGPENRRLDIQQNATAAQKLGAF